MISTEIRIEFFFENLYFMVTGNGETEFNLISITGIDTIGMSRQYATSPFQDGSTVMNSTANNRQIDLRIITLENKREFIMKFFNAKRQGLMRITRNGVARQINYLCEGTPSPNAHIYPYMFYDIRLICANPYFRDVEGYGKNLAQVKGYHTFPAFWIGRYTAAEISTTSTKTGLVNGGHEDCPFTCRIRARGDVTNPSISNIGEDGVKRTIRVNIAMVQNDYIDIISHDYPPATVNVPFMDMTNPAVTVVLNSTTDILSKIDTRNTLFFTLHRGINEFEYSADGGIPFMDVYPEFRGRFAGV